MTKARGQIKREYYNLSYDDTIGQLARYMGWIQETKKDNNVKDIIITGGYDKKLDYALKVMKNIF